MKQIDQKRVEKGWSKSRLSREAGLNQVTVSLICNGRLVPGRGQLAALAAALGWEGDPEELLDEVDAP